MFIHRAQLVIRIAYAGAPLSGKTETLKALLTSLHGPSSGVTVFSPLAARGRTLYFDWAQYQGGTSFAGPLQCQITSVPGQTTLHRRRRALVEAADVVVFVVDSQRDQLEANRRSLAELRPWLDRGDLPPVGVICQANKRDLPGALELDAIREGLGLTPEAELHPSTAIRGEGVRVCFIAAVRACVRRAEELRARNLLELGEPPVLTGEDLLQQLRAAEGEGEPSPEAASAAPIPGAAAVAAPSPGTTAAAAAALPAPDAGLSAPLPGAGVPAAPAAVAPAPVAPAAAALAANAANAANAPGVAGGLPIAARAPSGADSGRPAVMPFAAWQELAATAGGAAVADAPPAGAAFSAAPGAASAAAAGALPAAPPAGARPAGARRAVMPMADWKAAGGAAGPAWVAAPAVLAAASRAAAPAVAARAAAHAPRRAVAPVAAAPAAPAAELQPRAGVRVTRPIVQITPEAVAAPAAPEAAAAPVARADPAAAAGPPAPWLHGRESTLVDAWPQATWQEALRAAGTNAEAPRTVGETLQARIGAGWQARAWGVLDSLEAARAEFRRMVSWLMRLGDVVSSFRCVVLAGAGRSWCAWQVVRQELTFDLLLRQSLDQDLLSKDAVQVLARVATDYIATAQDFALRGVELPIHLKTLAHENRATVYSAFLPPAPVPVPERDALADLATELRPIVPPHLLGPLKVTEALRELELMSEGRPQMVPTVELLQSLLIGE
jgi:signal recognition particle receptor subunit beta